MPEPPPPLIVDCGIAEALVIRHKPFGFVNTTDAPLAGLDRSAGSIVNVATPLAFEVASSTT
ncbi:MAG: hypothetical protein ACKOC1_10980 [Hyphomicrobiales bacterium]